MPWSQRRAYNADYPSALKDVATQVETMRKQGIKRVFVVGHSFGANVAIAYMAMHGDADGVIAVAPGHVPELFYQIGTAQSVDRAREMVAAGSGSESAMFEDINQGRTQKFRMKSEVYLSYFDPDGLGNMAKSAENFKRPVPFAWVIGTADRMYANGPQFAFEKAPSHPQSEYVTVQANHLSILEAVGSTAVITWIQRLAE
jgi:pimeloyl-ACP methyl ester carboxylesterase